uniref:Uncharacterized protein n=1 Tax=viral metagenome TaxID=1070528 RepID=A0A6H1ZWB5_9ZZZZ
MVDMKSKWKRDMKAWKDKKQTILAPSSPTGIKMKRAPRTEVTVVHTRTYSCPFCLYQAKIEKFLISTKKGFNKGLGQCPECSNQMKFNSLTAEMTPEQFAEWCYAYSADGYWQKVPFSKFSMRLSKLGISKRFWDRYKQLKGTDDIESYEDMLIREQKEQYDRDVAGEE